jgi:hypothetical protein
VIPVCTSFDKERLPTYHIIIAFKEPVPNMGKNPQTIVARLIDYVTDSEGKGLIITKGDANPDSIPGIDYPIYNKDYIGRVNCIITE